MAESHQRYQLRRRGGGEQGCKQQGNSWGATEDAAVGVAVTISDAGVRGFPLPSFLPPQTELRAGFVCSVGAFSAVQGHLALLSVQHTAWAKGITAPSPSGCRLWDPAKKQRGVFWEHQRGERELRRSGTAFGTSARCCVGSCVDVWEWAQWGRCWVLLVPAFHWQPDNCRCSQQAGTSLQTLACTKTTSMSAAWCPSLALSKELGTDAPPVLALSQAVKSRDVVSQGLPS